MTLWCIYFQLLEPQYLLDVCTVPTCISIQSTSQWRVKSLKTIAQCFFFLPLPFTAILTTPHWLPALFVCAYVCVCMCVCSPSAAIGWLRLLEGKVVVVAVRVQRGRSCWLRPSAPLFSSGCNPTPCSLHPPLPLSPQPDRQLIGRHQVLEPGEPAVLNTTKLLSPPPIEPQCENWAAKCRRTLAHSRRRISAQSPPLTQTDAFKAVFTNQGGFYLRSSGCFRMWVCVWEQRILPVLIVCVCWGGVQVLGSEAWGTFNIQNGFFFPSLKQSGVFISKSPSGTLLIQWNHNIAAYLYTCFWSSVWWQNNFLFFSKPVLKNVKVSLFYFTVVSTDESC